MWLALTGSQAQQPHAVSLRLQVESSLAVLSLKPRIELIKARHGEDKERISKETSLLYEAAGVNPLAGAGCLPGWKSR